mgnify:FL=1
MEAFMKKMSTKYLIRVSISVILLILLDQLTKIWAVVRLKDQPAISLIRGVFELQYLENCGSAFGMMQGARVFFIISTIVLFLLVCVIYIRIPKEKMYLPLRVIAVLFLAGAAGNFIDRVRQGFVVDFFYFSLINFPIFNVADIYVTTATIALIVFILFYYKEADLERIFSKKKG